MRSLAHRVSAARGNANVGLDYDRAGDRYRTYADGDADTLYDFDGQYATGEGEIWRIVGSNGPLFIGFLLSAIAVITLLQYLPALALGPVAEHFLLQQGTLF
jgi:hypothetical protein